MNQFIIKCVSFTVIGAVVFGLSKLLRCKVSDAGINKPRRSALHAILAVGISMSILFLLMLPQLLASKPQTSTHKLHAFPFLASQFLVFLLYAVPAGIFMFRDKESLQSIGISRTNLWQAAVIGIGLAALSFCPQPGEPVAKLSRLTPAHGIALISYFLVGFGEEFLWRGYLQTRLVAWLGVALGWILTSVLMALSHFPGRLISGMGLLDAFVNCAYLIPVSLLMGFIMLRIRNLLAPGLFHTFGDWVILLT
jgi:membrane protease YdiL (CAAX protease family)